MVHDHPDNSICLKPCKNSIAPGILFLLLLVSPLCGLRCEPGLLKQPAKLWKEYSAAGNDSLRIERLSSIAYYYHDYLGNNSLADSVSDLAVQIAENSHRPEMLLLAYNRYLESNDLHTHYPKALDYALKAEQIAGTANNPKAAFRNYKNIASVYLEGYDFDMALSYSYKLLSIAGTSENNSMKAESYLCIGQSLEGKNQKIEAFRNYLNALSLADRIKDRTLQGECYARLSGFYNLSKLYSKATRYKLLERELARSSKPFDSVALMWIEYDLQVIDLNSNNNEMYESNMHHILSFAVRNKAGRLLNYEIALMRTHYIEADKIGLLHDLYYKRFPGELARLATVNPGLYFRLKAYFCEEGNRPDSALYYFNKAETILQGDPNIILRSNFYNRFGQFLARQGQKEKSIEKFLKSLELATSASYIEYMLGASRQLEDIYAEKGDYKNAYRYSEENKVLNDSVNSMSKKDQLLIIEIDHETRQRELAAEQEKQLTSRRHYLQYTAITIGILTVFIILIMLGSFKVHEWIIRTLGFFSFIFLFEFIILLADQQIHELTHGEPWKVLLIKIFLIAILLPLHHGIEKRVIAYLLSHKLLDISRFSVVKLVKEQLNRHSGRQADKPAPGRPFKLTSTPKNKQP